MQAGAMNIIAGGIESSDGSVIAFSAARTAFSFVRSGRFSSVPRLPTSRFHASRKLKGWAMKAFEFIDSGPPALLNNPCCCRRVVLFFPQTRNGGSLWLKRRKPRSRRL